MEGGRWFDIKRFDIEITHEAYQTGATDVLARRDLRRAVQIPEEVISYGWFLIPVRNFGSNYNLKKLTDEKDYHICSIVPVLPDGLR